MIANADLRARIIANGFKYWQVAEAIGISQGNFSIWLRRDLTGDRKRRTEEALDKLIEQRSKS